MKFAKVLSVFFALIAVALIVATAVGYDRFHQEPPMIQTPIEKAEIRTELLMDAICCGDYAAAKESLCGEPELQWNRETASELGALLWQEYSSTMSYAFDGPCYVTGAGVFRDVTVTVLDIAALRPKIQERYQLLMDPYLDEARYDSEAFDENGNLRQDFAAAVLQQAAEQMVLYYENAYTSYQITLELVLQNGQWWVVPTRTLIDVVAGAVTQ